VQIPESAKSARIRYATHSYRSWLDALGTAIAVQQKLMRHSDVRTTLNIYA
jgi:integrase